MIRRRASYNSGVALAKNYCTASTSVKIEENREKSRFRSEYRRNVSTPVENPFKHAKSHFNSSHRSYGEFKGFVPTKYEQQRNPFFAGKNEKKKEFSKIDDEDDDDAAEFTPFVAAKHPPEYYQELCRRLGAQGKIAEAVAVVEKRMLEDRVRPEKFNYITVIHILAKAGQARKAMEFFKKIRTAGYQPGPHTITSLMNACANAPLEDAKFALQQTKWLFDREKHMYGLPKTPAIYFAAMKSYARHGDVEAVFRMADEMVQDGWYPGNRIFAYLLSAALSDKEAGFHLALQIWRSMKIMKIPTELSHYQLLVKTCRDCGLGQKGNELLQIIVKNRREIASKNHAIHSENQIVPEIAEKRLSDQSKNIDLQCKQIDDVTAKSSRDIAVYNSLPNSSACTEKNIKLSMMGGADLLLKQMEKDKIRPDLKFFSSLLYILPESLESESKLMQKMREMKVEPDTEFCNQLIFRRATRKNFDSALVCLDEMRRLKLRPDFRTFVALSMTCRSTNHALTLLRDMKASNFTPDLRIFRNFLQCALYGRCNFIYARNVLDQMLKFGQKPDEKMIRLLEEKFCEARKILSKNKYVKSDSTLDEKSTSVCGYEEFVDFYDDWLKNMQISTNQRDPKLTVLKKLVDVDDLREKWEKPWLIDEEADKPKDSIDDNIEIVPSRDL